MDISQCADGWNSEPTREIKTYQLDPMAGRDANTSPELELRSSSPVDLTVLSERLVIQYDSSNNNNVNNRSISSLVIWLAGPVPYSSYKAVSYHYNATMMKDGQEVQLPTTSSVVSIADVTKVTRSGRVFGSVLPKDKEESIVCKKVEVHVVDPISASKGKSGESSDLKANNNNEVL
ncbi:hypothetical protein KIW84_052013 [Lathyrus oleraceus]|uniref:Uncharacterized protein n=1 Tax=Pisum sativum TaxID=3888 RepID=A0A9D4WLJ8_PEA|nr:hypothetical protein KIW84_052013 [Pisum sativum]